jgi:hypothetical protein
MVTFDGKEDTERYLNRLLAIIGCSREWRVFRKLSKWLELLMCNRTDLQMGTDAIYPHA